MRIRSAIKRTAGFTLVELLVAIALIILIMSILAQAFAESGNLFREAKGIGDMNESLRAAVVRLRDDLLHRHFDGSKKLSVSFRDGSRPREGFFRVVQGLPHAPLPPNYTPHSWEGNDSDGIPSYRVATHFLHMSVVLTGYRRENYFSAAPIGFPPRPSSDPCWQEGPPDYRSNYNPTPPIPPEFYMNSQRMEVMWFLWPMIDPDTGAVMTAGTGATPLFTLHRRQRLIATDNNLTLNSGVTAPRIPFTSYAQFAEFACLPDLAPPNDLFFPSLRDLANPGLRTIGDPAFPTSDIRLPGAVLASEDRVISDVISFEVKVLRPGDTQFQEIRVIHPGGFGVYDTATWPGGQVTLSAVQVIIRVFDVKTEQSRQITMIQDM